MTSDPKEKKDRRGRMINMKLARRFYVVGQAPILRQASARETECDPITLKARSTRSPPP